MDVGWNSSGCLVLLLLLPSLWHQQGGFIFKRLGYIRPLCMSLDVRWLSLFERGL